jgi:hypothetical protein
MRQRRDSNEQRMERTAIPSMPVIDEELMAVAQRRRGQISVKAVSDEYDRLLRLKSYRGLLARLFGQ